jgi:Flp pilus assembly pilin Flp
MIQRNRFPRQGAAHIEYVLVGGLVCITIFIGAQELGRSMDRVINSVAAPLAIGSGNQN